MLNPRDAIRAALTPNSPFNQKGYVWRSVRTLSQFASCEPAEVMELLLGDLSDQIQCRPNTNNPDHGPIVALVEFVAEEVTEGQPSVQVNMLGGNALTTPPPSENAGTHTMASSDMEESLEGEINLPPEDEL